MKIPKNITTPFFSFVMRYKITPEIKSFVKSRIPDEHGSAANICRKFGIKQPHLTAILQGNRQYILDDLWNRLCNAFPGLDQLETIIPDGIGSFITNNGERSFSHASIAINSPSVDGYKRKIMDAIMQSDLPSEIKDRVYNIILEVK